MKFKKLYKYLSPAIFLLLCLSLFTLVYTNDAKSKYESDTNGSSNTAIAQWSVDLNSVTEGNVFNVIAGNTQLDYTVKVESTSQVSCSYAIVISNVPSDVMVSLDDGVGTYPSSNVVNFTNVGTINISDNTRERTHKLTFSAPINSNVNNNQLNIQVIFTQLD